MNGRSHPSHGIHVVELGRGEGEPTLLLHGFTGSAESWGNPVLEAASRNASLLAVDLPGHGASAAPSDAERYGIERVVDGLVSLLDERGHARADWVGYSMGGRIALAAAILRPDRVRRLVLESTSPGIDSRPARTSRRRQDELLAGRIESRGIEWFVDFWMSLPLFDSQRHLPSEILAAARRRRLENDPAALAAILRGLSTGAQPSFWNRLGELQADTLILTGGLDVKYRGIADRMVERAPRAHHRSIADAGHTVHLEAPGRWIEEVLPFLRGW